MKIKTNCSQCKARNSLISVFTRDHYKKQYKEREYWTHSDKTAYYICRKCGYHDKFSLNRIIINTGFFSAYFLEGQELQDIKELEASEKKKCVICEQSTKPPRSDNGEKSHPTLTKLFLKKPKKQFLGYFCAVCRRAYYLPIKSINLEESGSFHKQKRVDLLIDLNSQLPQQERIRHPKYSEKNGLIQDNRIMDYIGDFLTASGAPIGEPDKIMHTISISKNKSERIINFLKKNGCEIIL